MEVRNLSRDVARVGGRIEGMNIVNSGSAGNETLPKGFLADSDRGDYAQPSDGNSARMCRPQSYSLQRLSSLNLGTGRAAKLERV